MKIYFIIPLLFSAYFSFAQDGIQVIKANSKSAFIIEGPDDRHKWNLSPGIKPDVYTITKSVKQKWVRFCTDVDSIEVRLSPGESFDFIVLLNNKDSCYTRLVSPALKSYAGQNLVAHDTIPFTLTEFNNIKIKAVLNRADTLNLMFDSGTTGLLLTNDAIKNKTHLSTNSGATNRLKIGNLAWDSLRVYPVELSGQGTDGRFGWDLFDGKVVEIDYDKSIFIVHTKLPSLNDDYSKFAMEYTHTLFCIEAELQVKDKKYKNRFLFDSGYQRTAMLDTLLMQEQQFPRNLKVIKRVVMKNGQGREIPIITVNNERLNLGKYKLLNIPVQLLTTGNPTGFKTHILGNEVLKRFNTILDFQNNFVYLKPNTLAALPYKDSK